MKYIKTYEQNSKEEPMLGDYVVCDDDSKIISESFRSWISLNIGEIIKIRSEYRKYVVLYLNIPDKFDNYFFNGRTTKKNLKMLKMELIFK